MNLLRHDLGFVTIDVIVVDLHALRLHVETLGVSVDENVG